MGKALSSIAKFQPEALGAHAPQSFRSGITTPDQGLMGVDVHWAAANESHHPLRNGAAAEQEDAYWHGVFTRASYYVTGRGYDQYRPAYALGWQAAFDYADVAQFSAIESALEHHWESRDTGSFLEWSQVRDAVAAAWQRGRDAYVRQLPAVSVAHAQHVLQPLQLQQLALARNLSFLMERIDPPPSDFIWQVLERHKLMAHELGSELGEVLAVKREGLRGMWHFVTGSLSHGWLRLRTALFGVDSTKAMQFCVQSELVLLQRYQALHDASLSPELDSVLERQMGRLQMHHAKLRWVQENWPDRL